MPDNIGFCCPACLLPSAPLMRAGSVSIFLKKPAAEKNSLQYTYRALQQNYLSRFILNIVKIIKLCLREAPRNEPGKLTSNSAM
jgi:hypothetical protein